MSKIIIPLQPLILTVSGEKPTIPSPETIMPDDVRFDITSDLMIGQMAYNVADDIWYYRSYTSISKLGDSNVTVNDVEVWRSDKIYLAGNVYISYSNDSSDDETFHTSLIYRCIETTIAGESPETAPSKWESQGDTVSLGAMQLTEDVTVIGIGTVGALSDNDVIPEGTTFTNFVKILLQQSYLPTEPTASLASSPSSTQEVGATVDFTLTPSFTQNDAGAINNVVFKRDTTTIQTQSDLTAYSDLSQVISAGTLPYSVEISYNDGVLYEGPGKTGQVLAGTIIANRNITGAYRNWYGPFGVSAPTTGSDARALSYSYSNTFTLNTGSISLYQVIAIPSTKSLVSVIDADALNANITSSYVLSGTITTVPDGGGNSVSYKVYIQELATPYSSSHAHNVTIG